MGRFNISLMRYLSPDDFRVLLAVEMGLKNHEFVPLPLISAVAGIHRGATVRVLSELCKYQLVAYERGKSYDGYRLTNLGYDFLALRALRARESVTAVGNQIGVGKESDVYVGGDKDLGDVVLKFHRLGRTSFRRVKDKRDYHNKRQFCSWLYLSRLSALKEFTFLGALYTRKFPVPKPIDCCRHLVVMGLIDGVTLSEVAELDDPAALYDKLMNLIVRLARHGLIHGDFNEFNLLLGADDEPVMIDFPQMISIAHPNAEYYFMRDVNCIREFFKRKFNYESELAPSMKDIERVHNLDKELLASGFTKKMVLDLHKAYEEKDWTAGIIEEEEESGDDEKDIDEKEIQESEEESDIEGERGEVEEEYEEIDTDEYDDDVANVNKTDKELRFDKWINETQTNIDNLIVAEGFDNAEVPMIEEMNETQMGKYEKAILDAQKKIEELDVGEKETVDSDDEENDFVGEMAGDAQSEVRRTKRGKVTQARSVFSNGSTIDPEQIRKRLLNQKRTVKKEKMRVKGKQSATNRRREDNNQLIKEYSDWF
uniref:Non-specific serine/threonine protein kinase n=1 Tax=Rhabditophanes sp. KR3021 TaxID=114890 RepID=A0AC35TGL8_9BILA